MLGLKRGTVILCPHDPEWERAAEETIRFLRPLFGDAATDIRHVGSTSIRGIHAKPILDIAAAARNLAEIDARIPLLEENGVMYRKQDLPGERYFVMGDFANDIRTHHIHVIPGDSAQWRDYNNFRDYLNAHPDKAAEYDRLKLSLAENFKDDRGNYTAGKHDFITKMLEEAEDWRYRTAIQSQSTLH